MSTPIGQAQQPQQQVPVDDDDTIREVLQTISAGAPPSQQQQQAPQALAQPLGGMMPMASAMFPGDAIGMQQPSMQQQPQSAYIPMLAEPPVRGRGHGQPQQQPPLSVVDRYWDDDAKKAAYVAVIAAAVLVLPVEKVVYQYVNIQHVPYSGALVKAACIAAAFYVACKLVR